MCIIFKLKMTPFIMLERVHLFWFIIVPYAAPSMAKSKAMDDDFNMPQGLSVMFELVSITNKNIDDLNFISEAKDLFLELSGVFGLDLKKKTGLKDLSANVTSLNGMPNTTYWAGSAARGKLFAEFCTYLSM